MDRPYRGMTIPELEVQYDARATVQDFDAEMRAYRALSDQAYADLDVIKDIPYGPSPDERIDLFPASDTNSPLLIFIHGGYWRALSRRDSAFMAKQFVSHNVAVAVVEYSLAPIATLSEIVGQARRAIDHLIKNSEDLPYDPGQLYVAGSSAGAHLTAMALRPEIKGALLASGLYDLEPLRFCKPNEWLSLNEASAHANSPMQLPAPTDTPLIFTWGETETNEFKRQSRDYSARILSAGGSVTEFEVPNRSHFDVITDLADTKSRVFRVIMDLIHNQKHQQI